MNLHTITQNAAGTWDASVSFEDGYTESITDLYDFDSALAWTHMLNAYHCTTGRYIYSW